MTVLGVGGHLVTVEAHVGRGLPSLSMTGLPGAAVQDARDRIRPALENAGLEWPLRRVVVNLSPGDLRKEGPGLDLPVGVSVLAATSQVPKERLEHFGFAGELALDGGLVSTPGILSVAIACARSHLEGLVVPAANATEAAQVEGVRIVGASNLRQVVGFLRGSWRPPEISVEPDSSPPARQVDLSEVRGQGTARRALEVAAAGGHNVLLVGPPGSGKTMLARRLPTILPPLSRDEALEATQLHSVAGILGSQGVLRSRPFRAPHHSVSLAGLLGGGAGSSLRPGEVSLAHHGVLFLDEMNEFRRDAIEGLRQPLEDGGVVITRAGGSVSFPARFMLVAAANPCPCGHRGDPARVCHCDDHMRRRYESKLSGPLLDRIDLRLGVPRLAKEELLGEARSESSEAVRVRVAAAREIQANRLKELGVACNAHVPGPIARRTIALTPQAQALLTRAVDRFALSGRGFDRALKVSRTIADIAGSDVVSKEDVAEALSYRSGLDPTEELTRAG